MTNITTLGQMVTRSYAPNSLAAASNAKASAVGSQITASQQNKLLKKRKKKRLLSNEFEANVPDNDI